MEVGSGHAGEMFEPSGGLGRKELQGSATQFQGPFNIAGGHNSRGKWKTFTAGVFHHSGIESGGDREGGSGILRLVYLVGGQDSADTGQHIGHLGHDGPKGGKGGLGAQGEFHDPDASAE